MEIQCPCCSTKMKKLKVIEVNLELVEIKIFCPICKRVWHLKNNDLEFMEGEGLGRQYTDDTSGMNEFKKE